MTTTETSVATDESLALFKAAMRQFAATVTIELAGPPVRRLNNMLRALQSLPLKATTVQTVQGAI